MTEVAIQAVIPSARSEEPIEPLASEEEITEYYPTVVSQTQHTFFIWKPQHGSLTASESKFLAFKLIIKGIEEEDYIKYFTKEERLRPLQDNVLFAVASSGEQHCVVPKNHLADFVKHHKDYCFVCQDAALDFHLMRSYFVDNDADEALEWWWEIVNECRMRDVHLLDILVRLALDDKYTIRRELEAIAEEFSDLKLATDRYKYGKRHYEESTSYKFMANKPPIHEDLELTEVAVRDAIVIKVVYERLYQLAVGLMNELSEEMFVNALDAYGPLSEGIQVKGAIVLADITKNGMSIDLTRVDKARQKLEKRMMSAVQKLIANTKYQGLFDLTVKDGVIVPQREGDTQKPAVITKRLEELLQEAAQEIRDTYNIAVTIPEKVTPTGSKISTSTKIWQEYADYNEFIRTWIDMEQAAHYIAFLAHLQSDRAHPEYSVIKRNGRTSAHNPPIQQTPRKGGFREIFKASPGHILVALDYDFIELCTLAAVCKARYGFSVLADVIIQGIDPHCFTAAMIEGVPLTEFMTWKDNAELKKKFGSLRQQAKAINFGIPSGLTANGLSVYAQQAYGVALEPEEAEKFRAMLIERVYPELSHYLKESEMDTLAENLGVDVDTCWRKFSWNKKRSPAVAGGIRNIVRGQAIRKKDSKPYNQYFVKKVWNGLMEVCRTGDLYRTLSSHVSQPEVTGNEELFKRLFGRATVTLTGRIRGRVGFTQACNTPFSGLAADGAKLAMWNLMQVGYKLVGFIHDEILLEIPESCDWNEESRMIEEIVCQAMQELTGEIPITVSIALTRVWSKQAKAVYDDQGLLKVWEPEYDELNDD